ncbi:MAG TPA: hypothetical protein VNH20_01965 [Candidatus Dormibacteraeota bacterium]|nr:hypothetical protein [Candidatus Dormibacteraeota bacterium]
MSERGEGVRPGEVAIRPMDAHRRRAALGAGTGIGAVLVPVGIVIGVLTHTWGVLLIGAFAAVMAAVASYIGQAHNQVFVGARGIRRVSRDCALTASWPSLQGVEVKIPGNRIVVFALTSTGVDVEPLHKRHSNAVEALLRHPPQGLEFRLDRSAADSLIREIGERRPDLVGIAEWSRSSRPPAPAGS